MIHGKNSGRWIVSKIKENPMDGSHILFLQDRGGQSIETVLKAVNSGLSFPALNDRIAELEKQLSKAEDRRLEWRAAIRAVLRLVDMDRQRYRSQSSERIRLWLEVIEKEAQDRGEPPPHKGKEDSWAKGLLVG